MLKKIFACSILLALISASLFAQNEIMEYPFNKQWEKADSLMVKGLPKSAIKIAEEILKQSENRKDAANKIKAQLFIMTASQSISEHSELEGIQKAEQEIAGSSGVEKALWQSITAQLYWNYYQQNRYKLLQRTSLAETTSEDINTWDAPAFFEKIAGLYRSSLENKSILQQTSVEQYAPLIIEGKNTRHLRPTIYDLLVFRALEFFQNEEKDIINPTFQFQLEGTLWFEPAHKFSTVKVKVKDASSLHFQALQIYQELIAFHLKDNKADALIDADLQRLKFVHQNSVNPEKDSLYLNALQHIEQKYNSNPAVAQVSYLIAEQFLGDRSFTGNYAPPKTTEIKNRNIPEIKTQLNQIIAAFPNTEGAINAKNLIKNLEQKRLIIKTKEVYIPNEPIKSLVSYQNLEQVFFKLYRVPNVIQIENLNTQEQLKRISKLNPLKSWTQQLPNSQDMEFHNAEIKVDALSKGAYILVGSLYQNITEKENIITSIVFQVSNLSLVSQTEKENAKLWVLDRKTGLPIPKTSIAIWNKEYNSNQRKYKLIKETTLQTSERGNVTYSQEKSNYYQKYFMLISQNDSLQISYQGYNSYYGNDKKEDQIHTFLFTDRSIYRPGQTIYFKGIKLKNSENGRKNEVLANRKSTIDFFDANNQKIHSLTLTTNEFGSFTGSFTAPESGLTGQMSIRDTNGQIYFSVEEYKRPKFFVEMDSLKGDYALNQKVNIKGFAKAYAGNNIDGATVNYRVVRHSRFPFYWAFYRWGAPSSPEMNIAQGTTITAEDGSFEIDFQTIPDKSLDPKTLPVFSYTVHVDITDINGETRSGSQTINAGYRSLQIITQVPEETQNLDSITVLTQNLNGIFVPATLKMTISPLQFPGKIYRKRLWEKPDQFTLSESEFRQAFPDDEYQEESDYRNWEKENSILEKSFTTEQGSKIAVPPNIWKNEGWHILEFSGKDGQGNEIIEKKYTYISIPEQKSNAQKPLIVQSNQNYFEPGETAILSLKTGFPNAFVLEANSLNKGKSGYIQGKVFDQVISENDRGGIGFSWLFVYNNRVYSTEKILDIPWNNKDLQIEWASHRNKLFPGEEEEWTLTIKGNKKEKVASELLAGMYDASLDAFKPHMWNWNKLTPSLYFNNTWNNYGFRLENGIVLKSVTSDRIENYDKRYDNLFQLSSPARIGIQYMTTAARGSAKKENIVSETSADMSPAAPPVKFTSPVIKYNEEVLEGSTNETIVQVRKNLQETAFFFPQLKTDAEGNITFKFTIPEALTEWKMMAFAHTKDWKTGYLEGKIKTQKDLMVIPNLPRFLRQGDQIEISTKINNLSDKDLSGIAKIEILNAETMQPVHLAFGLKNESDQQFSVSKGQSTIADWSLSVPRSLYTPVIIRITAQSGNFSDGEENTLPVITNRMLVTETLPLPIRGEGTKSFHFEKLKNQESNTLVNHALTVEFTGNPAWYAVQALPYLMEYPYDCSEQVFSRFYANGLAAHIVSKSPKIEEIFNNWKTQDTAALLSNLEKNQELKSALLEEVPWVMDAKNESGQKQKIAKLFETHQIAKGLQKNLQQLEQMQLPDGSFPWFKGMSADRFITQYIITGLGKLKLLDIANYKKAEQIIFKGLPYLDEQIKKDYDRLIKDKADLYKQHIGHLQVHYLYMRSFLTDHPISSSNKKAFEFYQKQAMQFWSNFNPYMKGMLALALDRSNEADIAVQILASLKETMIHNEEMGSYWKNLPQSYWWYDAPIEAQSLLIETFSELEQDEKIVNDLKVWLLKQKQTQHWRSTKATADAVYALLLKGGDWLANEPEITIQLGDKTIRSSEIKTESGAGYFKECIEGKDVDTEMGNIQVSVGSPGSPTNTGVSWGAVYWQYFEDMDKITSAETPLVLKKQLFIEKNSDKGPLLTEIKDGNALKVGDKVVVRIILQVDRDMEYVHLKDMRAACFEPTNVLSGYKYQGGLGYYESTKDLSTHFFFNRLRKGTFVFEYSVFVNQKGNFSNGISTIQCMYAPEFSSHSEGIRIGVK